MGLMVLPVNDNALCTQVLVRQQIVAILPAGHRLARRRQIGLLDLDGDPVVWIPQALHPNFHSHIAEWWRGVGYHPTVVQEAEGLAERLQFVANGEGISFAADSVRRLHHPGVAFRIIVEPEFSIEIGLVYRCDSKSVVLQQVLKSAIQHFVPEDVTTDTVMPDNSAAVTGTQTNQ
ncbi:MAG: LysR family substrate-binding domain-containing protein [Bryobacteraceae bacterium]|nr:LysR family substrate-binding domain-containing protein [Bryobacteraceae bacterium]